MSIDEMTGVQALERAAPDLPMRPGNEPGRNAVLNAKVRQFVRDATGDPRLTAWEEIFLVSMAAWVAPDGPGAHRLTKKQWAIIAQITAKIEAPLVDDSADDPDRVDPLTSGEDDLPGLFDDDDNTSRGKVTVKYPYGSASRNLDELPFHPC